MEFTEDGSDGITEKDSDCGCRGHVCMIVDVKDITEVDILVSAIKAKVCENDQTVKALMQKCSGPSAENFLLSSTKQEIVTSRSTD